jgi:putative addiction module component (TIGR02574 family)
MTIMEKQRSAISGQRSARQRRETRDERREKLTTENTESTEDTEQCVNIRFMSRDPAELLKEALALPPEARAVLADSLLESLDEEEVDKDAEAYWQREIQRRRAEIDSGKTQVVPWSQVRAQLMATLRNGR